MALPARTPALLADGPPPPEGSDDPAALARELLEQLRDDPYAEPRLRAQARALAGPGLDGTAALGQPLGPVDRPPAGATSPAP